MVWTSLFWQKTNCLELLLLQNKKQQIWSIWSVQNSFKCFCFIDFIEHTLRHRTSLINVINHHFDPPSPWEPQALFHSDLWPMMKSRTETRQKQRVSRVRRDGWLTPPCHRWISCTSSCMCWSTFSLSPWPAVRRTHWAWKKESMCVKKKKKTLWGWLITPDMTG